MDLPLIAANLAAELRRMPCRVVHAPGQPCRRCDALREHEQYLIEEARRAIVQEPGKPMGRSDG
jgi:hypothetical protein